MWTNKNTKLPIYKLKDLLEDYTQKNKKDETIPVYSVTNKEGFTISTDVFSKEVFSKNLKTYKIVSDGDFAYNPSRINVGSIDFFRQDGQGLVSPLYVTFRTKNSIDNRYLKYYLKSKIGRALIRANTSGSVRDTLSFKNLSNINIPLPLINDQKRYVKTLDQADTLRRKRKQAIELLDEYLKSVFLDMFGDPVSNSKGWDVIKFGEIISEICYGSSRQSITEKIKDSIPILRIPNILKGSINNYELQYQILPPNEKEKLLLKKGDILFVRTNGNPDNIGRCAVCTEDIECIFASYLIRTRLFENSNFDPIFIRYLFSMDSYKYKIRKESRTTAGNYNINTKGIKNFDLINVPKKLQQEFIAIYNHISSLKQKMLLQSEELETQFQALSQRAFKGEL